MRNDGEFFGRGVVGDLDGERNTPFLQSAEILQWSFQQLRVGNRKFFTRKIANSGGFQANLLHSPTKITCFDGVARFKRFIEMNRQAGEQIRHQTLGCETDGDSAHTQAGDNAGDIEVGDALEDDKRHNQPDQDASDNRNPA